MGTGIPERARVGDPLVSANLLNFCLDNAIAYKTQEKGTQHLGTHNAKIGAWGRCYFNVYAAEEVPSYSVFCLKEKVETTGDSKLQIEKYDGSKTSIYANGQKSRIAHSQFNPYKLLTTNTYRLKCDTTNPPAVGDLAQPKVDDWTVEKGGDYFFCVEAPSAETEDTGLFLPLPVGRGTQRIGFVVNNDIAVRSTGTVELYDKDDVPNGIEVGVYNPHDVVFYKENTTPGEDHPADRVILFSIDGWEEPVIFPFMLSACDDLDPVFDPEDV